MIATPLIAARIALMVLALASAGIPLYLRIAGQTRPGDALRAGLALVALLSAIASLWWAAASIAAMAGVALADLDLALLRTILGATPLGTVLGVRIAGVAAFLLALAVLPRNDLLAAIGVMVLASMAWTGHAGASEGVLGSLHRLSDVLHLVGAAVWLGALFVFVAATLAPGDRRRLIERLHAFARTGTLVVSVLAVTGAANTALIARSGWSPTSAWSGLLAVKIALFAAMLGLAALNRWKLTPALAAGRPGAEKRLRRSLLLETACALAIVALVAALGLGDPAGA